MHWKAIALNFWQIILNGGWTNLTWYPYYMPKTIVVVTLILILGLKYKQELHTSLLTKYNISILISVSISCARQLFGKRGLSCTNKQQSYKVRWLSGTLIIHGQSKSRLRVSKMMYAKNRFEEKIFKYCMFRQSFDAALDTSHYLSRMTTHSID